MNRLLIIITRMYAKRGEQGKDAKDEFVTEWGGDAKRENLAFSCSARDQHYHLLVVHGYEYPGDIPLAVKRAEAAIEDGLNQSGLMDKPSDLKVGLAFHPRMWGNADDEKFASRIESYLKSKNINPAFVKRISHDTPVDNILAPQCRATPNDFSEAFIKAWNFLFLPNKMSQTRHSIASLFTVVNQNLNWWKDINFGDLEEAKKVVGEANGKVMLARLDEAKKIVLGDAAGADNSESIKSIAEQVALDMPERKAAVEKAMNKVTTLFSNSDYEDAKRTLSILPNKDKKVTDEMLKELKQHIKGGKSLLEWFAALLAALENLKNELIVTK